MTSLFGRDASERGEGPKWLSQLSNNIVYEHSRPNRFYPNSHHISALYQGKEIGFLEFAEVADTHPNKLKLGTWYIMSTRVNEDFRRRGIASQMLKEAEKHMSGTVTLDSFGGEAETFWKSQGFKPLPEGRVIADTIRMVKQL